MQPGRFLCAIAVMCSLSACARSPLSGGPETAAGTAPRSNFAQPGEASSEVIRQLMDRRSDDTLTITGATQSGTKTIDGEAYNVYTIGDDGTTLIVDEDVNTVI